MTKQALRFVLVLNGLFVLMILAFRLSPNDDNVIRTLLLPSEGCPAPCFMNVRAGITSGAEAARLIAKHGWAQPSLFYMRSWNDMYARFVSWQWSGQQPVGVNVQRNGLMRVYNNQAVGMVVDTTLSLGAVWLALGVTDKGTMSIAQTRSNSEIMLVLVYPKQGLLVRTVVPKRLPPMALWTSKVEIESSDAATLAYFSGYHLPALTGLWGMG
jgi:hypothetical protein